MKINKIEFENFRNFKDHGEIVCSTDGKVTIVYGKNGDGKTTLHQLFQWIFYGRVRFNKTTTDRLYNLQYEEELSLGEVFSVMGCIDFEHDGSKYSIRRTILYKKELYGSSKVSEDFVLSAMDEDHNWRRVTNPTETIERMLPSGLADYFFFDGESMIADLRLKGKDSAGQLRKALFSMFNLDILENAISHIGRTDLKTTVLGKLYLNKGTVLNDDQITLAKVAVETEQDTLEKLNTAIESANKRKAELQEAVFQLSEKIGSQKSKASYEKQRKLLKSQRDLFLKNAAEAQARFGDVVFDMFPPLLISKAVEAAKGKIHLKVAQNKLPGGLTKQLIAYLLDKETKTCVCGRPLCENELNHIMGYLDLLPPKSFASLYNEFSITAKKWGTGYDQLKVEHFIMSVLENVEQAEKCDQDIQALDEAEKTSASVEDLIVERQKAEQEINELDEKLSKYTAARQVTNMKLKSAMKKYDKLVDESASGAKIMAKIRIMEGVASHFRERLDNESKAFSKRLEENMQSLVNRMLTSTRNVSVNQEFSVRVTDSYNDESKSEGQFAVVSFAYIGGILKLLRSEEKLASKEYPLILDGPFSKLDPDQRKNVVDVIPQFAPQVILFSKDDLHGVFNQDSIGRVWTIVSNDEKNVARVEEGHLWN